MKYLTMFSLVFFFSFSLIAQENRIKKPVLKKLVAQAFSTATKNYLVNEHPEWNIAQWNGSIWEPLTPANDYYGPQLAIGKYQNKMIFIHGGGISSFDGTNILTFGLINVTNPGASNIRAIIGYNGDLIIAGSGISDVNGVPVSNIA